MKVYPLDLIRIKGALTSKPYAFNARSWELKSVNSVDVFDTFGTQIRYDYRDREILRVIPRNDFWITDRTRFFYDGLKYNRLQYPLVNRNNIFVSLSWADISIFIHLFFNCFILTDAIRKSVNFVLGNFIDIESLFVFKRLILKKFVPFVKTNVHLHNVLINLDNKKSSFDFIKYFFTFNDSKKNPFDFYNINFILLVALNLRIDNPILNAKLRRYMLLNDKLNVFSLGSTWNYNYSVKSIGSKITKFVKILKGKDKLSVFLINKSSLILIGSTLIYKFYDLFNLINTLDFFFEKSKKKFYFTFIENVTTNLNAAILGYRLLNLDNLFTKRSLLFQNDMEFFFFINAENRFTSSLNSYFLKNKRNILTIYQGHHYDNLVDKCTLVLPSASFIEKNALYFSLSGLLIENKRVFLPSKNAKIDWQIFQYFSYLFYQGTFNLFLKLFDINIVKAIDYKLENMKFLLHDFLDELFNTVPLLNIFSMSSSILLVKQYNSQIELRQNLYRYIFNFNNFSIKPKNLCINNLKKTFYIPNTCISNYLNKFFSSDPISKSSLTLQLRSKVELSNFKTFNEIS